MNPNPWHGPKVLLAGYNGACNTGAEALLLSDIADLRALLGPRALITVPTLNEANLRRYVKETPHLRIAPIPTLFFAEVRRLVREHDLVMLVEGATFMDSCGSALLWAFLWAARCARRFGKPCLAYAVDAGSLTPFDRLLTRRVASGMDQIILRTRRAAERLRGIGVRAPIEVTADNAFNFRTDPADRVWLRQVWPQWAEAPVGLAPVDFHRWPVLMRPWGRKEDCYKWPYYFSRSAERRRASRALAEGYAALADELSEKRPVALICMEPMDERLARAVHAAMRHPERARLFSAAEHDTSRMTTLLRGLSALITSRFHGAVLSLAAGVPQVAVAHDQRLDSLYRDIGLHDEYLVDSRSPRLLEELNACVRRLLAEPGAESARLARGYAEHSRRAANNRVLLARFLAAQGWLPEAGAAAEQRVAG